MITIYECPVCHEDSILEDGHIGCEELGHECNDAESGDICGDCREHADFCSECGLSNCCGERSYRME
jgi:hypothetical protein